LRGNERVPQVGPGIRTGRPGNEKKGANRQQNKNAEGESETTPRGGDKTAQKGERQQGDWGGMGYWVEKKGVSRGDRKQNERDQHPTRWWYRPAPDFGGLEPCPRPGAWGGGSLWEKKSEM